MSSKGEIKKWMVQYDHSDGRKGIVRVTTEVRKSSDFKYGNGKTGSLTVGEYTAYYDLRYNHAKNLHVEMLKDYFGEGLVSAKEV
jgi:hypothetical protein